MSSANYPYLRGIEPLSLCDWPGHTSLVLFLSDCDFRCPTCHNRMLAWEFSELPVLDRDKVFSLIASRKAWLDGLVISGGEPTLHSDLFDILVELKQFGLPVKVDSNGQRPHILRELLSSGLVHTFAVDVKGPWECYAKLSGGKVDAKTARSNLTEVFRLAEEFPGRLYFRCTQVPLLNDNDIDTVRSYLPAGYELTVQKYIPVQH